jgi:hypothetical protein
MVYESEVEQSTIVTRMNIGLTRNVKEALGRAIELGGNNKTDTIGRALVAWAFILEELAQGREILVRNGDELERIRFL